MEANDTVMFAPKDWTTSDEMIKVLGVGGGGCNAVSYMYRQGIQGCSFIVCNTDPQALLCSPVPAKIHMGEHGAGTDPIKGRNAALDSQEEIESKVMGPHTKMLFITAGMGGGTGTGATPVIAKMAKDKGILTVGVVTIPFSNEGNKARTRAVDGIRELEKNVDSLLVINNEKLYEFFGDQLIHDAFPKADEVLLTAVRGIIEIIKKPGYINVDFEDIKTLMKDSGMALMGYGTGSGEDRIRDAVDQAFKSPLLNDFDLTSAKNVLVNITSGKNDKGLKMDELNEINRQISEYTGNANNFKRGLIWDEDPEVGDTIHITSIVTGLKFIEAVGTEDIGDYINIPKTFVYDRSAVSKSEGISLSAESYKASDNRRTFRFEKDEIPVLATAQGNEITEYENTPAWRRYTQQ